MKDIFRNKRTYYRTISICAIVLFVGLDIASMFVARSYVDTKLLLRVISRGVLGLLILFNSGYFLFASKPLQQSPYEHPRSQLIAGILLGIVGLATLATALMGYGINGDPVYRWWE